MTTPIKIKCLSVQQPIGDFYVGAIKAQDLVAISFADVRRPEGRDIEKYIGTQRDLNEGRVAEIKKYVTTVDACFPTSIILAIDTSNADYNEDKSLLTIVNSQNVAKIIDGQHRIAGLKDYNGPDFFLNVTIFLDMDIEDQAMVFATINLKQTKVTKSLAYDLYDFAKSRSPQKTCHNIAKLMNSKKGSPLEGRIKILGKSTGLEKELITQATFVDRVLRLISRDPMQDKDTLKRNKPLKKVSEKELQDLVFGNMFIEEADVSIAKCLWNYFSAVQERWPTAWNNYEKGMILARTTGFAALVKVLPYVFAKINSVGRIAGIPELKQYFNSVDLRDNEFTSDNFIPGSSGEAALTKKLKI
ncbi:MAG: DGQHR domain-containing protein [Candidatus Omnitrophica bacterium]|nr:DGQHR domain-containing protein [Candidatus Omnitrophota bacterium]